MRVAIIDCGTNTFNLLVAETASHSWQTVFENKLPVKLGAGGFDRKEILPARFIRGLDALNCHITNTHNFECSSVLAFATSAIREASNGAEFMREVEKLTGIKIELIDGAREAELIYSGIKQTVDLGDQLSLIMDIGGGSTEFIIANATEIVWKKSFLLGVSRLHEMLMPTDRMQFDEINRLRNVLDSSLTELKNQLALHPCRWLVGSSGSFDTLLSLFHHSNGSAIPPKTSLSNEMSITAIPSINHSILNSTLEERLRHPSIPSIRAEYMPIATYMIKFVLDLHPFQKLIHSNYSLKEGAMQNLIDRITLNENSDVSDSKAVFPENEA